MTTAAQLYIDRTVAVLLMIALGLGAFLAGGSHQRSLDDTQYTSVHTWLVEECAYDPHPVSDGFIRLFVEGKMQPGGVAYFIRMLRSSNIPAAECWSERFPT